MFKLFRKSNISTNDTGTSSKLTAKISSFVLKLKTSFALTMSRYERRMNNRQRKISLIVFCLIMCSMSSYWLYQGIEGEPHMSPGYLKRQTITPPQDISLPDSLNIELLEEYRQELERQKQTPDSIKQ